MPRKPSRRRRSLGLRILLAAVLFLLVFAGAALLAVNLVLNQITRPDLNQEYITEDQLMELDLQEAVENGPGEANVVYPELDPESIQWTAPKEEIGKKHELINILLIGQDSRSDSDTARSDSMILVTVNLDTKSITMTSFLRDLYVQIPGYQDNRLNAAYAFGGMHLLDETLEANFGVTVDGNITVNFDSFSRIIDILGGVDIYLTEAEADHMRLSPGPNHMDGETALSYARIRYIDSDFGRSQRQRNVITALYYAFRSAGITELLTLTEEILPMLTTDMSNTEIMSYAAKLAPILSGSTISGSHIPAEGTYTFNSIRGMSVIVADLEQNRLLLSQTLEPTGQEDSP